MHNNIHKMRRVLDRLERSMENREKDTATAADCIDAARETLEEMEWDLVVLVHDTLPREEGELCQ